MSFGSKDISLSHRNRLELAVEVIIFYACPFLCRHMFAFLEKQKKYIKCGGSFLSWNDSFEGLKCLCRESRAVDTESLCVLSGKSVWAVRVDLHILDNGG